MKPAAAALLIARLFAISLLLPRKGLQNVAASCTIADAAPIEPADTNSKLTGWVLNHNHPSSCPGQLTQYEILHHYNNDGDVYLSLWTSLGNDQYSLVEGSIKQVSVTSGDINRKKRADTMMIDIIDQFVYAPNGSVVGTYVPINNSLQVVGHYSEGNGICGTAINENYDESTTVLNCSMIDNNDWIHVTAKIETVDCGSLDSIPNGHVSLLDDSTLYGSVAVYQCNVTGYILTGNEKRFCSQNATWNGTEPVCELFNCTVPSIVNGIIQGDSFSYGSSISYSCNEGYYLTGDSVITCGINMTWNISQTPAVCNPVNCGDPGIPAGNGSRITESASFDYLSVVTFNCTAGYNLMGSSSIECLSNGTWNNSLPECDLVSCGDPGIPSNGSRIIEDGFTYQSVVFFNCTTGYNSMGSSSIECLSDGTWNNSLPVCEPVSCGDPGTPNNGSRITDGGLFDYLSIVIFDCTTGYNVMGSSSIECLSDGTWNSPLPVCKLVNCSDPGTPNNGKKNSTTYSYGTTIDFNCQSGYNLSTSYSTIICLDDGNWSDATPMCEQVTCDEPSSISYGKFNKTGTYTYMTSVLYKCDDKFVLEGKEKIDCLITGSWSGGPPKCINKTCDIQNLENNEVILKPMWDTFIVDVVVQLSCGGGKQLNTNESVIQCLSTGKWNYTSSPECIQVIISSTSSSVYLSSSTSSNEQSSSTMTTTSAVGSSSARSIVSSVSATLSSTAGTSVISSSLLHYSTSSLKTTIFTSTVKTTALMETTIVESSLTDATTSSPSLSNQVQSSSDGLLNNTSYIVIGVLAGLLILVMIIAIIAVLLLVKAKRRTKSKTLSFANREVEVTGIELSNSSRQQGTKLSTAIHQSVTSSDRYTPHHEDSNEYSLSTGYTSVKGFNATNTNMKTTGQFGHLPATGDTATYTLSTGVRDTYNERLSYHYIDVPKEDNPQLPDTGNDRLSYDYIDVPKGDDSQLPGYATVRSEPNENRAVNGGGSTHANTDDTVDIDDIPTNANACYATHSRVSDDDYNRLSHR